jgi:glycosyltransferase involved in cell wall biosynthesis
VSAFSRQELAAYAGADPAAVTVVPGGVDHVRMHPAADAEAARAAHGLGERPYVLTVASRTSRKNLVALGPAATRLQALGVDLFAAGGGRPQFDDDGQPPGVRPLGHVEDHHLPGLDAGAAAFVLPSRHEGYGQPCLEAMACGTPVLATTAGALPDTCGDAALLADPDDHDGLAAGLERLLTDEDLHADLRARGLRRAARFSWERTAAEVHAALRP